MPADSSAQRMVAVNCPVCQGVLSAATNGQGEDCVPQFGTITICLHCTAPLRFDFGLTPVRLSQADIAALDRETRTILVAGLREVMRFRQARKGQP